MKWTFLILTTGLFFTFSLSIPLLSNAAIRAAFESPPPGPVSGISIIRGWAFETKAEESIAEITVFIDASRNTSISCCSERQDVQQSFPTFPSTNTLKSGWGLTVNWGDLSGGSHTIHVEIRSTSGETLSIGPHTINVISPGAFPFLDQFDLSTASVTIQGQDIVLSGVTVKDKTSQQTATPTLRFRWGSSTQTLGLIGAGLGCPCPAAPDGIAQQLVDPSSAQFPEGTIEATADCPQAVQHETVQDAVNLALDDDVIGLTADTTENVTIGTALDSAGGKDLFIVGCNPAGKISAALPELPTIRIADQAGNSDGNTGTSLEKDIELHNMKAVGSHVAGFQVDEAVLAKVLLKSIRAEDNDIGVLIKGDSNEIRGANGLSKNRVGLHITSSGNNNTVKSCRAEENTQIGFLISGAANILDDNKATDNLGRGYRLTGSENVLKNNRAQDNEAGCYDIASNNLDEGSNQCNGETIAFGAGGAVLP